MSERTAPVRRRSTWQQRELATYLQSSDRFRSAQEIHAEMARLGHRMGLATVYKQLTRLVEDGRVEQVRADSGEVLYRDCDHDDHHHHVMCRSCGRSVAITAPEIEDWSKKVARSKGFTQIEHTVEIVGLCRTCRAKGLG